MNKISPFTPISFSDMHYPDGFMQTFHVGDHIVIEVFHDSMELPGRLFLNDVSGSLPDMPLSWNTVKINNSVSFYRLRDIEPGVYRILMDGTASNCFRISDCPDILNDTVLLQYAMNSNKRRTDVMSWINGECYYFDMRIPGGFKDAGWTFAVENEQFLNDDMDIVELSAVDYTEKNLTVGSPCGVPMWIAEKLNHILSCDYLFVDGLRYSVPESSNIEIADGNIDKTRFVLTQTLREAQFMNVAYENKIRMNLRRVNNNIRRYDKYLRKI